MSLRKAIDAKCRDCIYDPLSGLGNWRQQVTGCTATDCPLYPVRPVSKSDARLSSRGKLAPDGSKGATTGTAPHE